MISFKGFVPAWKKKPPQAGFHSFSKKRTNTGKYIVHEKVPKKKGASTT